MTLALTQIIHKIKGICNKYNFATQLPQKIQQNNIEKILKKSVDAIEQIDEILFNASQMKTQYEKLQQFLQKQQTEIRKHIGVEQQMKLYTDGLKLQLQQSQKERKDLLVNSKQTIKNLKFKNQLLFSQLSELKKNNYERQKNQSQSIDRQSSSLKKIIKTQYIERNCKDQQKDKEKRHIKLPLYKPQPKQKLPTHSSSNKKQKSTSGKKRATELLNSRKKEIQRFSNFTILTYMNKERKQKNTSKSKSLKGVYKVEKLQKKMCVNKNLANAKQKHKKIQNRSIFSVSSINYRTQSKKKQ